MPLRFSQAVDNRDGTYSVTFTPSESAGKTECFVVVLLADEPLQGSPFRCQIVGECLVGR